MPPVHGGEFDALPDDSQSIAVGAEAVLEGGSRVVLDQVHAVRLRPKGDLPPQLLRLLRAPQRVPMGQHHHQVEP